MKGWQYLESESRKYKISQIKPGDLIKLKSDVLSIIYHYGIVIAEDDKLAVYHNTPDFLNRNGGNIVKEPLDIWLKDRDIISIEPTGLSSDEIHGIVKTMHTEKYDFLNFNCEHFTNYIKSKKRISPQVAQWAIIIASASIAYLIFRKSGKKA